MATTIQVSKGVKEQLDSLRMHARESYNELLSRLLEDYEELSEETKTHLKLAEADIKKRRIISHARVKQELGL